MSRRSTSSLMRRAKRTSPRRKFGRRPTKISIQRLLDLSIARIDLKNGWLRYDDRKIPLTVHGENLQAQLDYYLSGPSYRGSLAMNKLSIDSDKTAPIAFDFDTKLGLYKNRVQIESGRLGVGSTEVTFAGSITDLKDPRIDLDVKADAAVADVGPQLRVPKPYSGRVKFAGKFTFDARERLLLTGRMQGSKLAIHEGWLRVDDIGMSSDVRLTTANLELRGTRVNALGGTFTGMADVPEFKRFKVNGRIEGVSIGTVTQVTGLKPIPYGGAVTGPVEVTGSISAKDLKAAGKFDVTPGAQGVPVHGAVEVAYDQRNDSIQLGNSYVIFPASRLDVSGTLGSALNIRLESRDLDDVLPAMTIVGETPVKLPFTLEQNGSALFEGTVNGPLKSARVAGALTLTNLEAQKQRIDRLVANLTATSTGAQISSFALGQDKLRLEGSADLALQNWKLTDASGIKANVKLQGAEIEKLLKDAGQALPIRGLLTATASVDGTAGDPRAAIKMSVAQPLIYGEKFDRVQAEVRYAGAGVEVISGVAEAGTARVLLTGAYQHPVNDYTNGRLRFDVSTRGYSLESVANVQKLRPGVRGNFQLNGTGSADVRNGALQPDKLDGSLALRDLVVDGRPVGSFTVDAKTAGTQLGMNVSGNLRGSKVTGAGSFQLSGDYPGSGSVEFSQIAFSTLQDFFLAAKGSEPLPIEGTLHGKLTFSGPAKKPELMRGRLELPDFEMVPSRPGLTPEQIQDLALRNAAPIVLEYDGKAIQVRSADLIGRETDLRTTGAFNLVEKSPWDLKIDGKLDVGLFQDFNTDIVASGGAIVNASIRGTVKDPLVTGKVELKGASFNLTDIPNGLDNANGTIIFDQRRATIERLTAETGGGKIALAGFVGFGAPEMSYRLQARADDVRIRYPEGVSTTVSSTLSLTGSSSKSILSGVVTVRRAGFNPRTDIGGILAASARPVATPTTPNPFLRGMQLDVRIETAPGLQFQTSLTSDLQAEADLRIRGTAAKPALLGRMVVNQGDVQFFGTKYTINRGEIGFYNPAKIEPVLDMDLETRVRGVLVTINFTGPLSKLNVSYRSDPPLQSTEIIALLAVGRAPGTNSQLASGQTVASQGFMATGTNTLLGQAVTTPITGRLQRFFGVSKLKIDPQLTGINAVPQARVTIEQQVSRDVTLTYITNLSSANRQIVRLEWDINRSWSVVALREDNGAFGIDFFFKKRF